MTALSRHADWIQTFTGKRFYPLDPRPEEVCIEDIAHALAMKCRYAGHTSRFYSVAEHSVHISQHVPTKHRLWGLLHDAAEAYSADIPSPLKRWLKEWHVIEARIQGAICERFGLPAAEPDEIKIADRRILVNESKHFMTYTPEALKDVPALPWHWVKETAIGWPWQMAEHEFLVRFKELYRGK